MARVQKDFIQAHRAMKIDDLRNPMIFVVDMINGFIKEGALHDEAILACVPAIQALLKQELPAVFIADSHPAETREFQSFPAHCIADTTESEVIAELQPYCKTLFHKNSTNTFTCDDFKAFREEELYFYDDIIITGCCTDICILQFALCLNAWFNEQNEEHKRIIVPIDCVETYHIDGVHPAISNNTFALENMKANGIVIVSSIEKEGTL